jgi:hypothetical protein
MLAEISCNKFIDDGEQRGPIEFGPSLNVVLGSSDGSNSIGKSTFLLIVDFAFGGSEYAKSKTTLENVGPHKINFAYRFDDECHYFSRSPMDSGTVLICNQKYEKLKEITLGEFNDWLYAQYGMEHCGGTFRSLTSNFIRVYGKENYSVDKPLASNVRESQAEGVKRLLRLFEEYECIDEVQIRLDDATKAKTTYNESLKRNFIASAANKREVEKNSKRINELEASLDKLEEMEHDNLSDLDPIVAERVANLKASLSKLRRRKTILSSQIKTMESDADLGRFRKTKDFDRLLKFFPGADLKPLREIETFHEGLIRNLTEERRTRSNTLKEQIKGLELEISATESKIREAGSTSNLTKAVLKQYSETVSEIKKLKEANASYEKKVELASVAKSTKEQRDALVGSALSNVQSKVNDSLARLNEKVCGSEANPPRLSLNSPTSYSFGIANDTGTGSQTRALALFDVTLLRQTPLPAIALDTISIKQVGDEPWLKILDLYREGQKQVFISFDKAESYSDGEIPNVIKDNVVLELSKGHELFGKSWATENG